jgi:hypothetical protein
VSPTDPSNINIWEEPDLPENLQFAQQTTKEGEQPTLYVSAGTLNKLVEQLTNEKGEGSTQCAYPGH